MRISLSITTVLLIALCSCGGASSDEENLDIELAELKLPKALLASRYESLDEFQKDVKIDYTLSGQKSDTSQPKRSKVVLTYLNEGFSVMSILKSGISQDDIQAAKDGDRWDQLSFVFNSPYAIRHRKELNKILILARRKQAMFGDGDIAFYDLAEKSLANITTPSLAFKQIRDSSEKGYINTFNHVAAQAFISTLFSETLADFVADVHELHNMPELTSGIFSEAQLLDSNNYPLDNYIDMVNNELGQEIGNQLRDFYGITAETVWTEELLSNYLNNLQRYYMWSFGIGMKAISKDDILVLRFTKKLNNVLHGHSY